MSAPNIGLVNTTKQIGDLVDWLVVRHTPPTPSTPTMYIDLEGVQLSRDGTLSILTLLVDEGTAEKQVYLVDVHTLGAKAFDTAGTKQKTMKDILQDDTIPKVFFDIRSDSDALFAHFGVKMAGVEDVQLMENATRTTTKQRRLVSGLARCIEQNIHGASTASWKSAKEKGEKLFKSEHGGSYEVFNQRPLSAEILSYCVGDVQFLPELRNLFWSQTKNCREVVDAATERRIAASQSAEYQPRGPNRALAPWTAEENKTLDKCHGSSTRLW
ncbi:hypothetical protein LTR27_002798 [Elasticomyces elasticus]|nr:hypothetical protein LTR27_002798 [Elasticomyces elasticus]